MLQMPRAVQNREQLLLPNPHNLLLLLRKQILFARAFAMEQLLQRLQEALLLILIYGLREDAPLQLAPGFVLELILSLLQMEIVVQPPEL